MRLNLSLFLLLMASNGMAASPEGIPRELARERAGLVSDLHYHLRFTLTPHTPSASGHEDLSFKLKAAVALLLDFREGTASNLVINGKPAPAVIDHGHIELAQALLKTGENRLSLDFTAPVAPAGKAITRFEDKDDGSEYLYTLFVPMDADMAFPCFDQPDLKGRFQLELSAPADWTAIANGPVESSNVQEDRRLTSFAETRPISTYLFAFAAGPFRKVHETAGLPGLYVRQSKLKRAEEEAPTVQQVTADAIQYLSGFFAQPFPFPKYDMVMIPGFAYGGMEHAGATFLREEAVLFRTVPTHSDRLNRDILLLHELTHQWFGDLTTMRWFDDLWLKEGFAQYMAYRALAELKPKEDIWKRFYQAIKPGAYGIDSTKGTTPIYQEIPNLKDAKSAYGAIVYSKAPGVIKQLAFVLGETKFRDGLRLYLKEHAYANAEWSDLVGAFERVSGKSLQAWAAEWIRRRGMPQVDVDWACDAQGFINHFELSQHDVLGEGGVWPIAMQVLLAYDHGNPVQLRAQLNTAKAELKEVIGRPCPQYVFANDQDHAYGRFLLDAASRAAVLQQLGSVSGAFQRMLLWGSLWNSVREAEMAPREFLDVAVRLLPSEKDASLLQNQLGRVSAALFYYVNPGVRAELLPRVESIASDRMLHAPDQDFRIIWYRALRGVAPKTAPGREKIKDLLHGKLVVPGVEVRPLDRWSMVGALLAVRDPDAETLLAEQRKLDPSGEGLRYAYEVEAGRPDAATKKKYFDEYLHEAARPEDWIEGSLGWFNDWNQQELTLPYLKPALDALPQVKRERKIFFVLAWLNAFIGGQGSVEAQRQVHDFLASGALDKDLERKVLEVSDELDRTVRIRRKYK
ncbi:MAG TPA: M1 family aminopeptidase [Candidatus Saccharimonadales bacterium]|jgi:aminopeptidase N|nr:M1 family aminopeptidase [Candidatus Saccharimonadales bacterium]